MMTEHGTIYRHGPADVPDLRHMSRAERRRVVKVPKRPIETHADAARVLRPVAACLERLAEETTRPEARGSLLLQVDELRADAAARERRPGLIVDVRDGGGSDEV